LSREMVCSLICKQMGKRDDSYGSIRFRSGDGDGPLPRSFGSWRRVWRPGPVLSRLLGDMTFIAIWLRLGGGPRLSTTARGGATLITTSAAEALMARAPENTNPSSNCFPTITASFSSYSWLSSTPDATVAHLLYDRSPRPTLLPHFPRQGTIIKPTACSAPCTPGLRLPHTR